MKSTGVIRNLDELGRIVIPMELRNKFKLKVKDPIEIFVDGNSIVLKKYESNCIFCGSSKKFLVFEEKMICEKCAANISRIIED